MPKIKIALVVPNLNVGGSEKVITMIANQLDKEKFEVHFIIIDATKIDFNIEDHVKVYPLNIKRIFFSYPTLRKLFVQIKPAIVFSTLGHLNLYLMMCKSLFPKNIKFIGRESTIVTLSLADTVNTKKPELYRFLYNKFYHKFDVIVCQSNDMITDFANNFNIKRDKITLINNPVFSTNNSNSKEENKFDCIAVGRLNYVKGFDRLIEISSLVKSDLSYAILGNGGELEDLKNKAVEFKVSDNFSFLGYQKKPMDFIKNAKLILMTSHYEGFPNVLLEAGILGVPCIAFDVPGGIKDIIVDGVNGFLIKNGDHKEYAQAIDKALHHNFDSDKIKQMTLEKFGMKKIMAKYEALFTEVANQ